MNKNSRTLLVFLFVLILSGCSQLTPKPCMELTKITPQVAPLNSNQQATLEAKIDPATAQVLQIYPLRVGSTWVYEYLGFDERMEVTWRVTETVVETKVVNGYYLAKLVRTAECHDETPPEDFLNVPQTGTFWYLIDGHKLYFFEGDYDFDLSNAWLDFIIPFPEPDQGWYPNPDLRKNQVPGQVGYRHASEPYQEILPIGGSYTCYHVPTNVADAKTRQTFCETVGFLYKEYIYFERNLGYRVELAGFSVQ